MNRALDSSESVSGGERPRPSVSLIGEAEHADFSAVRELLAAESQLTVLVANQLAGTGLTTSRPELIVVAQSRSGTIGFPYVEHLRRAVPLAGVVSLLGSWCEGQARASRPVHDTLRLYWHEFAPWWRRQLALRASGRCPGWARPESLGFQTPPIRAARPSSSGTIVLSTLRWETADVLADVLRREGYATVWQPPGGVAATVRGATAGIWEGGQLNDREAEALASFCQGLATDAAPVVALLDFPRRDRCEAAREAGAAAVLGKPWINADLIGAVEGIGHPASRSSPVISHGDCH